MLTEVVRETNASSMKIEAITLREIQMPLVHFFETSFGRVYSRRILLLTQSLALFQALLLAALTLTGKIEVYQLILLGALLGGYTFRGTGSDSPVRIDSSTASPSFGSWC